MEYVNKIDKFDLRLYPFVILPGVLAFLLLALAASEKKWLYWVMFIGGWYLSSLIWWHLYRHYVSQKEEPNRKAFYISCLTVQFVLAIFVITYATLAI